MHRSIRPKPPGAQPSTDDSSDAFAAHSPQPRGKRQQIHTACSGCRSARTKCDGKRPCGRCNTRGACSSCSYEVQDGETRMSSLKKKVISLEEEVTFLRDLIDNRWNASQMEIRTRVRDGPSNLRTDTPQTTGSFSPPPGEGQQDEEETGVGNKGQTIPRKRQRHDSKEEQSMGIDSLIVSPISNQPSVIQNLDQFLASISTARDGSSQKLWKTSPFQPSFPKSPVTRYSSPSTPAASNKNIETVTPALVSPPSVPQTTYKTLLGLLFTAHSLPSLVGGFAERLDDHIAILAVLKGWSEVERSVALDPQWQLIKTIDKLGGESMRPVDRLVALKMARLIMKYHAATGEDQEKARDLLPQWASRRITQSSADHPNMLIRYIPWPLVRTQFATDPSLLNPVLLTLLYTSFRFSSDFTPAAPSPDGLFELTPNFRTSLWDLSYWTVSSELFAQYPSFAGKLEAFKEPATLPGG